MAPAISRPTTAYLVNLRHLGWPDPSVAGGRYGSFTGMGMGAQGGWTQEEQGRQLNPDAPPPGEEEYEGKRDRKNKRNKGRTSKQSGRTAKPEENHNRGRITGTKNKRKTKNKGITKRKQSRNTP